MATMNDSVPGSGYGNPYLDSLIWGCGWTGGPIRYYFAQQGDDAFATPGRPWQEHERQAFRTAFALYENVANIDFVEVNDVDQADIVEWLVPSSFFSSNTTLGAHELPDPSGTVYPPYGWFNFSHSSWSPTGLVQGGYGFVTVIHELGHALGLAHPHDGGDPLDEPDATLFPGVTDPFDTGDFGLNQGIWTTMSYNDGWDQAPTPLRFIPYGYQGTPMAFDVAALQAIYGTNMTYHTGADVYAVPKVNASGTFWSCIWDAGGTDEITAAGAAGSCKINLNDAPLTGPDAGGFVSWIAGILGGFTIANGVVIENATGGNGSDTLTGNEVANILTGNAGNDSLDGGIGTDTMRGGAGNDIYIIDVDGDVTDEIGGSGTDLVQSKLSRTLDVGLDNLALIGSDPIDGIGNTLANAIIGNLGANKLAGLDGNDTLTGDAGADTLDGGLGSDRMAGGTGDDLYWVDLATDIVTELALGGKDTIKSTITLTLGTEVENLELLGAANLNATGNALANLLVGNSGNSILDGKAGVDTMRGGAGDDIYLVDDQAEVVDESGGAGKDTVKSTVSIDSDLAAGIDDLILLGTAIVGLGNGLNNVLTGTTSANILTGRGGDDSLIGGAGKDKLTGDEGNDTLDGGTDADEFNSGAGNDRYIVDNVGDIIFPTTDLGEDTVQSSVTWKLGAEQEILILTGAGAINGIGNLQNNLIVGNVGANILDGGEPSIDTMRGAGGNDTYIVDATGDVVEEKDKEGTDLVKSSAASFILPDFVENLTIIGTGGVSGTGNGLNNVITGNDFSNLLSGAAGNDTINGDAPPGNATQAGNDTLDGGAGSDSMAGGFGDDLYKVDSTGDRVIESSAAGGRDTVESSQSFILGANFEDLKLLDDLANDISGTGNTQNNLLIGNFKNNTLDGKTGEDTMRGGQGNDTYIIDNAKDVADEAGGSGVDTVVTPFTTDLASSVNLIGAFENLTLTGLASANGTGTGIDNTIIGNGAVNQLFGLAGNDSLAGGAGNDSLVGGTENDTLDGGTGGDSMDGGDGNDTYVVDSIGDKIVEASGTDTVKSSVTYALVVGLEHLVLIGAAAINATGTDGFNNQLTGNDGANVLDGLTGDDVLAGNKGNDTYKVDSSFDQVIEVDNGGIDTVLSTANFVLSDKNVENLTLLGTATTGTGNASSNKLVGTDGFNQLDGGAGVDTLVGGKGNDTYFVDVAQDVITETSADPSERDNVKSTAASYTLSANVEDLLLLDGAGNGTGNTLANNLTGNGGNNSLSGAAGNDSIIGNGGGDTLDGGTGNDTLEGGEGDDLYIVDSAGDIFDEKGASLGDELKTSQALFTVQANIEHYTFTGAKAIDFDGDDKSNRITGTALADTLDGAGGNDTLDGGAGVDNLSGGTGDDTYVIDSALDKVTEAAGDANDTLRSSVTVNLTLAAYANIEHVELIGAAAINATGSDAVGNKLLGNDGANILDGLAGNDTMEGGKGNDTYKVDVVADVVLDVANGGTDLVQSKVTYSLVGTNVENLTLLAFAGALNATGNELNNFLTGNDFANVLDGKTGIDTLVGGKGDDSYVVDDTKDVVTELLGAGTDTVTSSALAYTLAANVENLILQVGTANISGTGNTGDNSITGNDGNNTLNGGTGKDSMSGGLGDDTYVVDNAGDTVTDSSGIDTVQSAISFSLVTGPAVTGVIENLTLTGAAAITGAGNDQANALTGNSGANTLTGDIGADTLDGGLGADSLVGGTDNDTYVVDNAGDKLRDSGGIDTVKSSVTFDLTDDGISPTGTVFGSFENLVLTGAGAINGSGNDLANEITGNSAANILTGGKDADTLDGGLGNDTFRYTSILDGHDVINNFDGNAVGGQDLFNLDALFDSIAVAAANRAARVSIIDNGDSVDIRVDADGNGADGFELFAATINTADDISVGQDVILGT